VLLPASLTEKVLLPGKASVSSAIHEYISAQKRLAAFAQGVHDSSELCCDVVHDFLTSLASSEAVPAEVRDKAEEVTQAFAHIMNAIDLSAHVPTVSAKTE
jgi:hypothetical protein